jgi:hypothetical protein
LPNLLLQDLYLRKKKAVGGNHSLKYNTMGPASSAHPWFSLLSYQLRLIHHPMSGLPKVESTPDAKAALKNGTPHRSTLMNEQELGLRPIAKT